MPAGQFRGMRTGGKKTTVRGKYKEPKAKKGIRNWTSTRTFNGRRYTLHSVSPKEPTKKDIEALKKQGYYVRTIKQKHPQYGYRYTIMTSPVIGKYGVLVAPKGPSTSKKKKSSTRKRK